jgi:hypothetical protein
MTPFDRHVDQALALVTPTRPTPPWVDLLMAAVSIVSGLAMCLLGAVILAAWWS